MRGVVRVMADRRKGCRSRLVKWTRSARNECQASFKLLEYRYRLLTVPSAAAFEPHRRENRTHTCAGEQIERTYSFFAYMDAARGNHRQQTNDKISIKKAFERLRNGVR